jgi:hypothetical protein
MMERDEILYRLASARAARVEDFAETIAKAWSDMRHPGTIAHELALTAGVNTANYPRLVEEAVEVRSTDTGPHGIDVAVAGLLRGMGREDWRKLWTGVLLPRLIKRFGAQALAPLESSKERDSTA